MVKVVEKLKERLRDMQVDERHNLDSLGLLYEELQDLRKEALLADSELDALLGETQAQRDQLSNGEDLVETEEAVEIQPEE